MRLPAGDLVSEMACMEAKDRGPVSARRAGAGGRVRPEERTPGDQPRRCDFRRYKLHIVLPRFGPVWLPGRTRTWSECRDQCLVFVAGITMIWVSPRASPPSTSPSPRGGEGWDEGRNGGRRHRKICHRIRDRNTQRGSRTSCNIELSQARKRSQQRNSSFDKGSDDSE